MSVPDRHLSPNDTANQTLVANVHPVNHINPEPQGCYNLVVIGAGTAGLVAAAGAAGLGAKVALVERNLMGGDCLNYGCVPSKALIRASRAVVDARRSVEFGFRPGDGLGQDFAAVMARMRNLRAQISYHDSAARFRELGVDVFFGEGHFTGPDSIAVAGKQLIFKRCAICAGARASVPDLQGIADAGYLTNETVFSLTDLPPRLAVVGGGPIGCELAQAFSRFGSKVTIIETAGHLLSREDLDAAQIVQAALERDGVEILCRTKITAVTGNDSGKVVTVDQSGTVRHISVDHILVGTGRTPNVDGLELEKADIAYDVRQGVRVNDRLQTTNPRVYAAGDICSAYKFTHTADALARIVITNALFIGRQKTSALIVPWCTYTDPEVAHVGMYEEDARQKGIEVETLTVRLAEIDRAVLDGETEGFARVHLRQGTDKILGATIVARHAGEMINEITLAMNNGLGLSAIGRTIHPYPTQAEAIKRLADVYSRTRLTPLVKKVLGGWLKWHRR